MMKVSADLKAVKKIKPHEYAVRFLLGGAVTVAAGLIQVLGSGSRRAVPGVSGNFSGQRDSGRKT